MCARFCSKRCAQHVATVTYREKKQKEKIKDALEISEAKAEQLFNEAKRRREAKREAARLARLDREAGIRPLDPAEAKRRLLGVWPQHPPTMRVRHKRLGLVTINVGDFDPDVHTTAEGEGGRE
jgi:hypothetical protein